MFDWPADGKLLVPGLKNGVAKSFLLGKHKKLATTGTSGGVLVSLPAAAPNKISSTVVLQIKGEPVIDQPPSVNLK